MVRSESMPVFWVRRTCVLTMASVPGSTKKGISLPASHSTLPIARCFCLSLHFQSLATLKHVKFQTWMLDYRRVCVCVCVCARVCVSSSVVPDSVTPWTIAKLLCSWDFPDKNSGVGCHFLLQGIFLTQGLNASLLLSRRILNHWATWEAPKQ